MSNQYTPTIAERYNPKAHETYADNDPRREGRTLSVVSVHEDRVRCIDNRTGRHVNIDRSRFINTRQGYRRLGV